MQIIEVEPKMSGTQLMSGNNNANATPEVLVALNQENRNIKPINN